MRVDHRPLLAEADFDENEVVLEGHRDSVEDETRYHRSCFRWVVLILFMFCGISVTMVQFTFSPIFYQANRYFGPTFDGENGTLTATAINFLSVLFPLMYVYGSYKAAKVVKGSHIRVAVIQGMSYAAFGTILRFFSANAYSQRDPIDEAFMNTTVNYVLMVIGTAFVALAAPIFLNIPTLIALVWFSVAERELAMTAMTLTLTLGMAVGNVTPSLFVLWEPWNTYQSVRDQVSSSVV
jgi:hypothetical protein